MKNILQENMRRFRTRNLREQAEEVPVYTGKELKKQGYTTGIGIVAPIAAARYRVDPALSQPAGFADPGDMALSTRLNSTQKQLIKQRKAHIVSRKLDNGKLVMQYIELI